MNIIQIASEAVPFAKTGGLGDVAGALPLALAREGHNISIILPYYTAKISPKKFKLKDAKTSFKVSLENTDVEGELFTCKVTHNVTAYLIKQEKYFGRSELYQTAEGDYPDNAERFVFFARAALFAASQLKPDIIHCHDWQSSLVPVYLKTIYKKHKSFERVKSLLTIHNLGYQGSFPHTMMPLTGLGWEYFTFDKLESYGKLNFLKGGISFADAISTVSKKYAEEILTPEFGCGLENALAYRKNALWGIVNGIDYAEWNPETDEYLPSKFSRSNMAGKAGCKAKVQEVFKLAQRPEIPLIGIISRLTSQKGFDLLEKASLELMKMDIQIVILGTGEKKYHELLLNLAKEYPQKIAVRIAFDNSLAHQIEAGSDFFLMPSRYEPCGLNQMISLKYGTIPIVRSTGGLDDTIHHAENGFKFSVYDPKALIACIHEALSVFKNRSRWLALQANAMMCDFSWNASAKEYINLYKKMLSA
ncbi:MAG: glycogen synthase GlgA [Deltaproteobacteria bacterium]|nr:glycogen synthase GlgA [Deltaproteobacteria bacterium]